jgi:hypothetical protein
MNTSPMRTLLLLLIGVVAIGVASASAAPPAQLWERWLAHDPDSMDRIDHSEWDAFLTRHVRIGGDGVHRIAYGAVSPADRASLSGYLQRLGRVPISTYARSEQAAFWINLYNALTVQLVLDHYPIATIRDIGISPAASGRSGIWDRKLIEVEGEMLSLNDIANRILRPIWRDPRIHYALSCAALGCPNLQPGPFEGDRLEQQLSKAAMGYINDPRCIQIEGRRLGLSSMYRWYRDDFGGTDRGIINHLMAYAEPRLAMVLQGFDQISDDGFDWRLNDATP